MPSKRDANSFSAAGSDPTTQLTALTRSRSSGFSLCALINHPWSSAVNNVTPAEGLLR